MTWKVPSFSPCSTVSSTLPGYLILYFALQAHRLVSAQFIVTGPDYPIPARVSGEAILTCQLFPHMSTQNMEVRWFRSQFSAVVHLYRDGQDQYKEQMLEYRGRTELLKEDMANGSVSLRIREIRLSDNGKYTCFFQSRVSHDEALLDVQVAETLRSELEREKEMLQTELESERETLQTELESEKEVLQTELESEKEMLQTELEREKEMLQTELEREKEMLQTELEREKEMLQTELEREKEMLQTELEREKEMLRLELESVQDMLQSELESQKVMRQAEKEKLQTELKSEKERLQSELKRQKERLRSELKRQKELLRSELRRQRERLRSELKRQKVTVTLYPDTTHPRFGLSEDWKSMRCAGGRQSGLLNNPERFDNECCVLGCEGFTSGRHCWEVEVGDVGSWAVGVAEESVRRKGRISSRPEKKRRAAGRRGRGKFWAFTSPVTPRPRSRVPRRIQVCLDCDHGQVTFFSASDKASLFTFSPGYVHGRTIHPWFKLIAEGSRLRLCP